MDNLKLQLSEKRVRARKAQEARVDTLIQTNYDNLVTALERKAKSTDEFTTFIAKEMSVSKAPRENVLARNAIINKLQENPNIISKLETEIGGHALAIKMQPYAFKWVDADIKQKLGFRAFAVKGLTEQQVSFLESKIKKLHASHADILHTFAQLVKAHADKHWIKLDVMKLTGQAAIPIESCIQAIQDLVNNQAVIVGEYEDPLSRKEQKRELALVIAYDDAIAEQYVKMSHEPEALCEAIYAHDQKDRLKIRRQRKRTNDLLDKMQEQIIYPKMDDEKKKEIEQRIRNFDQNPGVNDSIVIKVNSDRKPNDLNENKIVENVQNSFDNDEKFVKIISADILSYIGSKTADAVKERDEAIFERNKANRALEAKKEEHRGLIRKLSELEAENNKLKERIGKIQSKCNAYKDFSDEFSMNAQDQLTLLLHKVLQAGEKFAELQRYEKNNEMTLAKFTKTLNDIVQSTSKGITDYVPESKFPPSMK